MSDQSQWALNAELHRQREVNAELSARLDRATRANKFMQWVMAICMIGLLAAVLGMQGCALSPELQAQQKYVDYQDCLYRTGSYVQCDVEMRDTEAK